MTSQDEAILMANRNYDLALQQKAAAQKARETKAKRKKQQKQRREDMKILVIFCLGWFTGLLLLMALMYAFCIAMVLLM